MNFNNKLFVFVVFILLTIFMTYPAVFKMQGHVISDKGDPVFTSWVLSWDMHKFKTGLANYWDANIFYPASNTLAFSENLTGLAIIGFPIMLLTNDIILTQNILILLSFVLSGYCMYLLVNYLTKNPLAGVLAGLVFAFVPVHASKLPHVHMIAAFWLPLIFLYLHKYTDENKFRHLILFVVFYIAQCLTCMYLYVFVTPFVLTFAVYYAFKKRLNSTATIKLSLAIVLVFIFSFIFYHKYSDAGNMYGFSRNIQDIEAFSLRLESFFSAPFNNCLYSNIMHQNTPEGDLFIGFLAWVLVFLGLRAEMSKPLYKTSALRTILLSIWYGAIAYFTVLIALYLITKGDPSTTRPFTNIIWLLVLRFILDRKLRSACSGYIRNLDVDRKFYLYLSLIAVLLSFGPSIRFFNDRVFPGPYNVLFNYVPAFGSIRVVSRMSFIIILGISVLAGYGYNRIYQKYKNTGLWFVLIFILTAEFLMIPVTTPEIKTKNNIPEVYKWLGNQKGDFALIELPLYMGMKNVEKENERLYYSTFHWKKIANGYSGYFPPLYSYLYDVAKKFPSDEMIDVFGKMGLRYVVVNTAGYKEQGRGNIEGEVKKFASKIKFVKNFNEYFVYEIENSKLLSSASEITGNEKFISKKFWKAKSNFTNNYTYLAFDGEEETRWCTNSPRKPGMYFQLDLGNLESFKGIEFEMGQGRQSLFDFPGKFKIEVSNDSKKWITVFSKNTDSANMILPSLIFTPKKINALIKLHTVQTRYIKMTQFDNEETYNWSIHEINICN